MHKLRLKLACGLLFSGLLAGCLGGGEPEEFQLTAYMDRPLSADSKKDKLSAVYKRFLVPFGDKMLCDGKQFVPKIRIGRGDLESAPVFESGKLTSSAAGGADSFFGVPADATKLKENAAQELEKWDYKSELYSPASGQAMNLVTLTKRDSPNLVLVVSDNANARREAQEVVKTELGRDAPQVLGFAENPGDELNKKMIEALCAQPKKDNKQTSVAIYFLGDALPEVKVATPGPAVEPLPTPQVDAPKPRQQKQIVTAPSPRPVPQEPVVIVQPPLTVPPPPPVVLAEAPPANAKEACFQERKHRTDTTSIGDSLCVTRKCNKDPRFKGSAFCSAWLNQSTPQNSQ